jgi:hypothetical protein
MWVDTYGSEFSRDIEPTVQVRRSRATPPPPSSSNPPHPLHPMRQGGDTVWQVAASCVQLYKAGLTCATAPPGAPCCSNATAVYTPVWSLSRVDGGDHLLTNSAYEVQVLVSSGQWVENCHPIPGPSIFCVNTGLADGRPGSFLIYNTSSARSDGSIAPLYRCITPAGLHFVSLDGQCEGGGARAESVLGWVSTTRGGEFVRGLSRCAGGGGSRTHALDLGCDAPAPMPDGRLVLGYVK